MNQIKITENEIVKLVKEAVEAHLDANKDFPYDATPEYDSQTMPEDVPQIPENLQNIREDFMRWASEADKRRSIGGPINAYGLMYEYYFEDNDGALADLVREYMEDRGIEVEPDSQQDIWVSEEIRRAVNEWGYYQSGGTDEDDFLNESYGVEQGGKFLRERPGWGPTFTSFPQDAKKFGSPEEAQSYISEVLGDDFGAQVVHLPDEDDDLYESLKVHIKSMIRESFENFGLGQMYGLGGMNQDEKKVKPHSHHKEEPSRHKLVDKEKKKNMGKGEGRVGKGKRALVLGWLKDPSVNCAEIMRQLWNPDPHEEDAARSYFYKCRDGKLNDSGVPYKFSDKEINELYKIKSENS